MSPTDLDPTVAVIGVLLLATIAILFAVAPRQKQRITPARDLSWIDERIAHDTKNRATWRAIKRMTLEEENDS